MPFFVSLTYPFQPLQTCSMSPVNPLPKCVFCKIIFARHLNLFWGGEACLGPEKAQLPGEGKRSPSVYGWTGTDRTRVKKFRIYRTSLKNSLSIRTQVREIFVIIAQSPSNCIVPVQDRFLALHSTENVDLTESIFFEDLHGTYCRPALGCLEPACPEKKNSNIFSSYRNALTILKACGQWRHVFGTSTSPGSRNKNNCLRHPLPLPLTTVNMILNV